MKTIVVYRYKTKNVGDIYSGPQFYYNLGTVDLIDVSCCDLDHVIGLAQRADLVVIGGGGLFYGPWLPKLEKLVRSIKTPVVVWGTGLNYERSSDWAVPAFVRETALHGMRDAGLDGIEWVPCPSCMGFCFRSVPEPTHPVVIYDCCHQRVPLEADVPRGQNDGFENMLEAVDFLAQGETVVTSSYHGAYWATLLGRKVAVYPWRPKMIHMEHQPGILPDKGGIADARAVGLSYPNALAECRWANQTFERRVKRLVRGGS